MPDDALFSTHIPVRWGDQDALGHVNNAAYMVYIEQARIEFLQEVAEETGGWPGEPGTGPILVAAALTYRKPIVYPATVVVSMTARPPGRTSAGIDAEIRVEGDPDTVYASAETTLVWVNQATGRPVPLPAALRERLGG